MYAVSTPLVLGEISQPEPRSTLTNLVFSTNGVEVVHCNCRLFHLQCSQPQLLDVEVHRSLGLVRVIINLF